MSLKFNGATIPYSGYVNFDRKSLLKVSHNGRIVWRKTVNGWAIIFSGKRSLSDTGDIVLADISSGSAVRITAKVRFSQQVEGGTKTYADYTLTDAELPTRIADGPASVVFAVEDGALHVEFNPYSDSYKGTVTDYVPESVEITEVSIQL